MTCPICRSDRAVIIIPASPEVITRRCQECGAEYSVPHSMPFWGDESGRSDLPDTRRPH